MSDLRIPAVPHHVWTLLAHLAGWVLLALIVLFVIRVTYMVLGRPIAAERPARRPRRRRW